MTLTETQQAVLKHVARRPDGLAISPAHLPPGPRAAMAKGLLAAGLVIRADAIDAEPDAGWKLDGQVTFLRIASAGRHAIGADESPVDATASRPESGGLLAAGAGETVDAAAASMTPQSRPSRDLACRDRPSCAKRQQRCSLVGTRRQRVSLWPRRSPTCGSP